MPALSTYLLFEGTCREAMTFYQTCLGGTLQLTSVGESPMSAAFPPAAHHKIVHAVLTAPALSLSASDWLRPDVTPVQGNTVCLYLNGGTAAETESLFNRLALGGAVTDPFRQLPFGHYGSLTDRYGMRWMLHAAA